MAPMLPLRIAVSTMCGFGWAQDRAHASTGAQEQSHSRRGSKGRSVHPGCMQQPLRELEVHSSISMQDLLASVAGKTSSWPRSWLQREVPSVSMIPYCVYLPVSHLNGFK